MNVTTVATDGICVYVHTKAIPGKSLKIVVGTALLAILSGTLLVNFTNSNSSLYILGLSLLLLGIVCTLPMLRTILWNLYGEETISFSTKSIVSQVGFGFFKSSPKTITYDGRLNFKVEIIREDNAFRMALLHLYSYDSTNQPFHLFRNYAYFSEEKCHEIIDKIQLIFDLDKDLFTEYSAN